MAGVLVSWGTCHPMDWVLGDMPPHGQGSNIMGDMPPHGQGPGFPGGQVTPWMGSWGTRRPVAKVLGHMTPHG